jgi:hypothetical protein
MGLVHYPVYNKNKEIIASAVTTIDLHDLSRVARTYGVKGLFVITPHKDQQRLAERVMHHWTKGYGATYNPNRKEALELIKVKDTLEDSLEEVLEGEGEHPLLVATDASRFPEKVLTYEKARAIIQTGEPVMLIFGTAWGMDRTFMKGMDYILAPVEGMTDYNHLSVRTAAAVILDRLVGAHFDKHMEDL